MFVKSLNHSSNTKILLMFLNMLNKKFLGIQVSESEQSNAPLRGVPFCFLGELRVGCVCFICICMCVH